MKLTYKICMDLIWNRLLSAEFFMHLLKEYIDLNPLSWLMQQTSVWHCSYFYPKIYFDKLYCFKKKNNRIFPENSFDILCNLSPKAAICQTLFSAKDKKKIFQNVYLFFPSILRTRRVLGLKRNVHTCT